MVAKRLRGRPVARGRCPCCASVSSDLRLYCYPTVFGPWVACAPCCRSMGHRPGLTADGIRIGRPGGRVVGHAYVYPGEGV